MGAGGERDHNKMCTRRQEAIVSAVGLSADSSTQPTMGPEENTHPEEKNSEQLTENAQSTLVPHQNTISRNDINERLERAWRMMWKPKEENGTETQMLVPAKNITAMTRSEEEKWQRDKTAILLELHGKVKQFTEIQMKLKILRKNKKDFMKQRAKLEDEKKRLMASMKSSPAHKRPKPSFQHCFTSTPETTNKSPKLSRPQDCIPSLDCDENDLVTIGPNGTKIPKTALENINWSLKGANVTRKILMEVFDRETLACHTLTGKPSPAFIGCNKPSKGKLDPLKVADIVHIVCKYSDLTEKEVRQAITTKCADENKMLRSRETQQLAKKYRVSG